MKRGPKNGVGWKFLLKKRRGRRRLQHLGSSCASSFVSLARLLGLLKSRLQKRKRLVVDGGDERKRRWLWLKHYSKKMDWIDQWQYWYDKEKRLRTKMKVGSPR